MCVYSSRLRSAREPGRKRHSFSIQPASQSDSFMRAYEKDRAVPTAYATSSCAEDFAEIGMDVCTD